MNTFDKVTFKNAYIDGFDIERSKLSILSTVTDYQENGYPLKLWNLDTSKVHGLTMLSVNECGFCSFAVTGKFLQENYFDGITSNTISKITDRLNNDFYTDGFTTESILSTEIGLVDNNVDVEIDPETIMLLSGLVYHPNIKVEVYRNGNIVFNSNKKGNEFRLTIYNKAKEFERQTKANNELRNHNVEPPSPNLWRFEVRIPTLNAIRRITGAKRLNAQDISNPNRKAPLLKPTLFELLSSSKNAVVDTLKTILSNVMIKPQRKMNEREALLYFAFESRQFHRMRTRAMLISLFDENYYKNHFSRLLTQIETECKVLEPNGETVTEVLKCLKP